MTIIRVIFLAHSRTTDINPPFLLESHRSSHISKVVHAIGILRHGCDNPKDSIFSVPFGGSHRLKDLLSGAAIKEFNEVPLLSDSFKEGLYILMRSGEESLQASVPSFHFIICPLPTTEHPLVHRPFTRRISRPPRRELWFVS